MAGSGNHRGFLAANGRLNTIPTLSLLPEGNESVAYAVNNSGIVVGLSTADTHGTHAFQWLRDQRMIDLGALNGFPNSGALAINDRADCVGYASSGFDRTSGPSLAVRWRGTRPIRLPSLQGTASSSATGIGRSEWIVGQSDRNADVWIRGQIFDLNKGIVSDRSIPPFGRRSGDQWSESLFSGVVWQG